jgi:hypothetical protein
MAGERRTRSEKQRAQLHRQEHLTYSFNAKEGVQMSAGSVAATKPVVKKSGPSLTDLFQYDTTLIYQDLAKTVVITLLILCAVIGVKVGLQ